MMTSLGNIHFRKNVGHFLGCSLSSFNLILNLQDLSLVPCHRLAYPELSGGHFEIQDDELKLYANEQINTYLSLIYYNSTVSPACISCEYNAICMKGCLGAQYEKFGDVNIAIPSVCNLFKIKYDTIIEFLNTIGLFNYIFKNHPNYPDIVDLRNLLVNLGYKEYLIKKEE